jgi:hypothetical protein
MKPCRKGEHSRSIKRKRELAAGRPRPELCEVCGRPPGKYALHFDHDHNTGRFRGWLCHGCNVALGMVNDDPERLRFLAQYLEANGSEAGTGPESVTYSGIGNPTQAFPSDSTNRLRSDSHEC